MPILIRIPGRNPGADEIQLTVDQRRFAVGARSIADLIAPAAVEVARDHIRLEYQYARVLAVVGYPRTVSAGWLRPLLDFEEPIELSLHVHPLESAAIVKLLSHKLVQLQSSRLLDDRSGRLADPEREVAFEDAERLRDALQRGEERAFSVSFYLLLRSATPKGLDDLTRRIESTLDGMLAHSRVAILEQERGFRACLPEAMDDLLVYRNLDTSSLVTMFPFTAGALSMERGVLYGVATRSQSPVVADPFDSLLENANLAVFAMAGAGKSYFVKLMEPTGAIEYPVTVSLRRGHAKGRCLRPVDAISGTVNRRARALICLLPVNKQAQTAVPRIARSAASTVADASPVVQHNSPTTPSLTSPA